MRCAVLLISVLSLAFAPLPFPRPRPLPEDLKSMQGVWLLASCFGEKVRLGEAVWTIKGDRWAAVWLGDKGPTRIIKLDAKTTPPSIDLVVVRGEEKPLLGRYQLEDDTLTVSLSTKDRPLDFSDSSRPDLLLVFRRKYP